METCGYRGKREEKKKVIKIVKVVKENGEFMTHLEKQINDFQAHVSRMKTQYDQMRTLKEKLPAHHAIIHMDFAENYTCKSVDEIQSTYWNQQAVTLHPAVIYTGKENKEQLEHQSYVIISDDLNHNASTVITFVREIVSKIKEMDENIVFLHFWTDSPTSQYRNKSIFNFVANKEETIGIKARWNYFESGHGKGPCDGLGGTTKRMADQAMKSVKVIIQDAQDFFAWTQSSKCTMLNVEFLYISSEKREAVNKELDGIPTKTLKGTMKVHAVVGEGHNFVSVREVSCYCDICLTGGHCETWTREITSTVETEDTLNDSVPELQKGNTDQLQSYVNFVIGDNIVATYEYNWYIGKIEDFDAEDSYGYVYLVSFMEKRKRMFQWPRTKDVTWCTKESVKFKINAPTPSGKSERMFRLDDSDWEKINNT